jgi:hypothetical protein
MYKDKRKRYEATEKWRAKNPDIVREYRRKCYEKRKQQGKTTKYYDKNKSKIRRKQKEWEKLNREKINARKKAYSHKPEVKEKNLLRKRAYDYLREEIIKQRKKCEKCQTTKNLEIHHKNYESNELSNLVLLCEVCHQNEHNLKNRINKHTNSVN